MGIQWLAVGLACLVPAAASAQGVKRPVVVELFTSQGCSSCPPADALVAEMARTQPDLLPLTFHVTYWNNLGWQDPFSFAGATERQRRYVALSVSPQVYTPAMVVDGQVDVIGSDRAAVAASLAQAVAAARNTAPVDVTRAGNTLTITVGPGTGRGDVMLIGYDHQHKTPIARGENGGRMLTEANIVRSIRVAGSWTGQTFHLTTQIPAGDAVAVLVQAADGRMLGAGRLDDAASPAPPDRNSNQSFEECAMVSELARFCAIGVMAKTPQPGRSKTRLCPPLQPDQAAALSAAFLRDTTESIAHAGRYAPIMGYAAYAPLGTEAALQRHLAPGTALVLADGAAPMPPGVDGFGRCLLHAIEGMLALGHKAACVLSSDTPTLPARRLIQAADLLLAPHADGRAVLGACDDGGYYLLGVTAAHAGLFTDIAWSTDSVAQATRDRARTLGLELIELEPWYDVDDAAALARLLTGADGDTARWTQAALDRMGLRDRLAASAA